MRQDSWCSTPEASTSPAVRRCRGRGEVAVAGRRQHAKAGLLLYRSPSGRKLRTKAFVTSANLTRSGFDLEPRGGHVGRARICVHAVHRGRPVQGDRGAHQEPSRRSGHPSRQQVAARSTQGHRAHPTAHLLAAGRNDDGAATSPKRAARVLGGGRVSRVRRQHRHQGRSGARTLVRAGDHRLDLRLAFNGTRALAASGEAGLELSKGLLSERERPEPRSRCTPFRPWTTTPWLHGDSTPRCW